MKQKSNYLSVQFMLLRYRQQQVGRMKVSDYLAIEDLAANMIGALPSLKSWQKKAVRNYINNCVLNN